MKRLLPFVCFLFTFYSGGFSQSEAVKLKEKADFFAARDGFILAVDLYSKAIEYDKKYYEAYFKRGMIYFDQQLYAKSESDFAIALKGKYAQAKSLYYLGEICAKTKRKELAEEYFARSIKMDSTEIGSYFGWSQMLTLDDQTCEKAHKIGLLAQKWVPDDGLSYHCIGDALYCLGNFSEALSYYLKASELKPDYVDSWYNVGQCYSRMDQREKALPYYRKTLILNPTSGGGAINLGYSLVVLKQYAQAVEELAPLVLRMPNEAFLRNNYGYALYKTGKVEEGLDQIYRSQKLDPTNSWVNRNLAEIFLEQGDTAKACAEMEKGIELGFRDLYGDELDKMKAEHCK